MSAPLGLRAGWPLYLGMAVAGAAAVVASASTLAGLARTAGWAGWTPWLLPAALDVGGSVGGWCWLRFGTPPRAREFGRIVAIIGALGTLIGNGAGHLVAAGYLLPGPLMVVIVGSVPAAVLVALAHLAALLAAAEPQHRSAKQVSRRTPLTNAASVPGTTPALALPERHPTPASSPKERPALAGPTRPLAPVHPAAHLTTSTPSSTPTTTDPDQAGTREAVLDVVRANPVTIAELVRLTGRSRTTLVGHLTALLDDGAITRDDDKRYRALTRPHVVSADHA